MTELVEPKSSELAVFDEVAAIITNYKAENENLVFDYADKQGAKDAKSHIAKLRKVKTIVSEIHKEAKAEALAFGRRLDAKKNAYNGKVDKMVKFHKDPLDVIEAEMVEAAMAKQKEYAEAEAKRIAEIDAREKAIILAEEKLAREKAEAEKERTAEKMIEHERIIKEQEGKIRQAEEKAKAEAEAEEERLADIAAEKAIEAQRKANKNHRKRIEEEAHRGLFDTGHLGNTEASEILEAIKEGKIPHITILY